MLPYGRKNPLPFPFSKRSHVGNLRQTIQGKGEKIRGWKPQVSTLLCARAASAQLPAEVQRKTLRPSGANTLTQFAHPAQPVQKKSAARIGRTRLRQFGCPSQPVLKKLPPRSGEPPARFVCPA